MEKRLKRVTVSLPDVDVGELIEVDLDGHLLLVFIRTRTAFKPIHMLDGYGQVVYRDDKELKRLQSE